LPSRRACVARPPPRSSKFDYGIAGLEACHDPQPHFVDRRQQRRLSTIAQSNPDKLNGRTRSQRQLEEVCVFADQHDVIPLCVAPDLRVGALFQPDIPDVNAVVPPVRKKSRQNGGELIIDEEFHEARKIEWSAW